VLNALPRRDHKFKEVSSNWREYSFINCTQNADTGERSCSASSSAIIDDAKSDMLNGWLASYVVVCATWIGSSDEWSLCSPIQGFPPPLPPSGCHRPHALQWMV
jgi:hypothetical protein